MKTIACLAIRVSLFASLAAQVFGDDGKSDRELLEFARSRAQQVRVTLDPIRIDPWVATFCRRPPPAEVAKSATNPHRLSAILVYANSQAVEPLWDPYEKFPVGSILLKEKFDADKLDRPTLYTGMVKREAGYYADCGDWEFFTLDGELAHVTSRGKLESCAACHRDFTQSDFVSKQYASLPGSPRVAYIDKEWQVVQSIAATSRGEFYLPASLAETHGEKLSRDEAVDLWRRTHENNDAHDRAKIPDDHASVGGPTMRYEPDQKKNTLGYWTNVQDWASWKIDVRKPETYQISALQGCGSNSGGSVVEVCLADQTLTFVVEETGQFQNFKWRAIGQVFVGAPGNYTLTVKPRSKPGLAVMDLRQIILRPAHDPSEQ